MPWLERTIVSQRAEVVGLAGSAGMGVSELARRFGVSRKTVYLWQRRHADGEPLTDRSHRPHHSPNQIPDASEQRVVEVRRRHPYWGSRKLHRVLSNEGMSDVPSPSTITRVLQRQGLLERDPASRPATTRFEAPGPNALWQMDFKGPFTTAAVPGSILSVLDDHSRFLVALHACPNQRTETVQQALTPVFRRYGLPSRLLCDNGPPWGAGMEHSLTTLGVWLIRLGIDLGHGRPRHPQTQGKVERFHETLSTELLRDYPFRSPDTHQPLLDRFRSVYNTERPHLALDLQTPVQRYRPSPVAFPETVPAVDYGPEFLVRRVQSGGWFSLRGRLFHLSKALRGQPVGLRPTPQDGVYAVYFCHQHIADINLADRS